MPCHVLFLGFESYFEGFCLGSYRRRVDIIADILQVATIDAKKTQIMFGANLSYAVLQKYLHELIEASLVSYVNNTQRYVLTSKGRKFLALYKEYSKINKQIKKRLKDVHSKKNVLKRLCVNSH